MKNYEILKGKITSSYGLLDVLQNSGYELKLPINIEEIINILGIKIKKVPDFRRVKVTGSIKLENGEPIIWINPLMNQSEERERFTLAHELGHFIRHMLTGAKHQDGFEDDNIEFNRDNNWNHLEMEANNFAASLLMPIEKVKELAEETNEYPKEKQLDILSKKFKVSKTAMKYRLQKLGV